MPCECCKITNDQFGKDTVEADLKDALTRAGVNIQKIERGEPTLEDVFLSLAKD